jgi:hypothetical protein
MKKLFDYIMQLATDAGAEEPVMGEASGGKPTIVDQATGECYIISVSPMDTRSDLAPGFDQTRAVYEGWCVITNGRGVMEIQTDDEYMQFSTDGLALAHVMEQCDLGIDYHRQALILITEENKRNLPEGCPDGFLFMTLRTWKGDEIAEETTVKVRSDYVEGACPYSQDACPTMGSNQDLVPLSCNLRIPDITWGNSQFRFAAMKVIEDRMERPVGCDCGACDHQFPINYGNRENLVRARIDGAVRLVAKCPNCGALAHNPKLHDE